jgi:DNA-binding winged helix-turn-helix (wHTH) protein
MSRPGQVYKFGPYRLECADYKLWHGSAEVKLRPKVFQLLCVFLEHPGEVLSKDVLSRKLWPDAVVEESNLMVTINQLRSDLSNGQYIETVARRGYRFTAKVEIIYGNPSVASEPRGGAVPLQSPFYISRLTDDEFFKAITIQDSIVLVKGARQVGKTSLLARGLQKAREQKATIILTDFQQFTASTFESADKLLLAIAESIADQLELTPEPHQMWKTMLPPGMNFERYLKREVFTQKPAPWVWGLDEVDRLFTFSYASEIFGLFRSWHNLRALDPQGPWHHMTMAIAYATEAHLFITDLNQSPFNVGTRLTLEDLTIEQVGELNQRYGKPLQDQTALACFHDFLGGHPYLTQRGLNDMSKNKTSLASILEMGNKDEGPFGDHLKRMLVSLEQESTLREALRGFLQSKTKPAEDILSRLRSAGILSTDASPEPKLRCALYVAYLKRHLL